MEYPVLIPGLGRLPGERNGYLLRYSCLQNYMDRGAWWASVCVCVCVCVVCVYICVCVFLKSCIANTKSVLFPRERGDTVYMPVRRDNMLTVSSKNFLVKLNWGMMEKWTCKDHEKWVKCQELRMSKGRTLEIDYSVVEQFHRYLNVSNRLEKCLRNIQFY